MHVRDYNSPEQGFSCLMSDSMFNKITKHTEISISVIRYPLIKKDLELNKMKT